MCSVDMFKIAKRNYDAAKGLRTLFANDESQINLVAYHLQQSVEIALKAFLECKGVTVPFTHDITKLVKMSYDNGSEAVITEWLELYSDTLTRWEVDTRYNYDFCSNTKLVDVALEEIHTFLLSNGITTELREELKDDATKKALLALLPKDTEYEVLELNCYYQVFRKKVCDTTVSS